MSTLSVARVSVVIPCYNYALYLPDAIRSVVAQTRPVEEVIVVDDGSTDATAAVARQWEHAGVVYVRQENAGPSVARNTGAGRASGDYIIFLDADDLLAPTYVERCLAALAAAPGAGYAYTQWRTFGTEEQVSRFPAFSPRAILEDNYVHVSALVRAELVRAHPFFVGMHYWEDWDFYLALLDEGIGGVLVDEPLLLYRKHPGSSMTIDAVVGRTRTRYRWRWLLVRRHPRMLWPQLARMAHKAWGKLEHPRR